MRGGLISDGNEHARRPAAAVIAQACAADAGDFRFRRRPIAARRSLDTPEARRARRAPVRDFAPTPRGAVRGTAAAGAARLSAFMLQRTIIR